MTTATSPYPIAYAQSRRFGLVRQIVNVGPGAYRWTITKDGEVVSTNTETTKADAARVLRSTTNSLGRR